MITLLLISLGATQASRTIRAGIVGASSADSETSMPSDVSEAIRKAKGVARKAVKDAEAREEIVKGQAEKAKEAADEKAQAETEKEAAAKDAAAAERAETEQNRVALKAARDKEFSENEWIDALEARSDAQSELQDAKDDFNDYAEKARKEKCDIDQKLKAKEEALAAAEEKVINKALDAEKARIAYKVAEESEADEAKELAQATQELNKATIASNEKVQAAMEAAREAEAAHLALVDATKNLNAAKEVVVQKKKVKDDLWELYDKIEEFYGTSSDVTKFMRRNEDCESAAHECLVLDGPGGGYKKLRKALEKWNEMVLKFMEIKEFYPQIYENVKPAEDEIEENAMAEIRLSCDPYKELELHKTEEEFNSICGDGLWPAVGLKKNRFYEPPPPDANNGGLFWFW